MKKPWDQRRLIRLGGLLGFVALRLITDCHRDDVIRLAVLTNYSFLVTQFVTGKFISTFFPKYVCSSHKYEPFSLTAPPCACAGNKHFVYVCWVMNTQRRGQPFPLISWKFTITCKCSLLSHVTRKPLFGICDQGGLKPACAAPEAR